MEDLKLKSALGIMSLMGIKGLGPATVQKLLGRFDTLGQILASSPDDLKGLATEPNRRVLTEGGPVVQAAIAKAQAEVAEAEDFGARVLSVFDEDYPRRLMSVQDRPLIIYTSGDLSLLDRSVACVGTRAPSDFGIAVTERVTATLADAGWCIVSGLARGVDAIAHEVALKHGAPTAAILGSGIDTYNSNAARDLAIRIDDAGGLIITEQPLGREADPASLIRRNRIQAGSSLATFFMQADVESGTMHSVRYALLQGRPIFAPAVPDAYANEDLNQAAMCMTRMHPQQFGAMLEAKDSVQQAIADLDRETVAFEITGKASYPAILADLEQRLEKEKSELNLSMKM